MGERTVSRLLEMCGDELHLDGTDQRTMAPIPWDDEPQPYGTPRARRLAS
jgi:hypothetical protein